MAVQENNLLMHGTSGSFSRQITFKQYNGRTIITRYPDMSKVVYTEAQLAERFRFKLAVAYARTIIADPAKKKVYSRKNHFSAFHAAISEYMISSKAEEKKKSSPAAEETLPATPVALKKLSPSFCPAKEPDSFTCSSKENPPS